MSGRDQDKRRIKAKRGPASMKAALYARYSSDKQREASIEDQFRNCERACDRYGWRVVGHYADEASSGATVDRPDYQALFKAAKGHEFDIIVVDEISRLWRDQGEQWKAVKLLEFWGVHILGVNDGINTQAGGYRLLLSIRGAMNEEARREIGWRTYRGQEGQVGKGLSAGGRVYGYRNISVGDGTKREINLEEAKWVLWIFERYAERWSPRRIAVELNRLGVPPPGAAWKHKNRRCKGWAASAIRGDAKRGFGILRNRLYVGVKVWNRTKRILNPETGARRHVLRPETEWVIREAPELRIVSQKLWERVQARLRQQQQKSAPVSNGIRRSGGRGPKYPLSGLLRCAVCRGNYVMVNDRNYGCGNHRNRGEYVCPNGLVVKRRIVEARVLEGIKRDLFTPQALKRFRKKIAELQAKSASSRRSDKTRDQLAGVQLAITNIVEAIKSGAYSPALQEELARLDAERERLLSLSQAEASRQQNVTQLLPRIEEVFQELVQNLESVLIQDADRSRQLLQRLVGEELPLHPRDGYLEAELRGNYAGLLELTGAGDYVGAEERT